jgi:hypothetical protein
MTEYEIIGITNRSFEGSDLMFHNNNLEDQKNVIKIKMSHNPIEVPICLHHFITNK